MKFRFTLVVWGGWHLDQLVAHGLPSLRAPGNLDAIDHFIAAKTTARDSGRLMAALDGLNAEVQSAIPDNVASDQGTSNTTVFGFKCTDQSHAADRGEAWALLAPDMVWGEGTFAQHRRAMESGKIAIFRPLLRVDASKSGTIRDFSRRHLAKVALECEHAIARDHYRSDSPKFSNHAEMAIWEAPGGLINRTVTAEVQTFLPARMKLSGSVSERRLQAAEREVIGDSDEAIALALCPPDKDFAWMGFDGPLNALKVQRFLKSFPSPASIDLVRHSYHLHSGDADAASWADADRRADEFFEHVFKEHEKAA